MARFNTPAIYLQYQDLMGLVEYIDRMSINKNKSVVIEWSVKCHVSIMCYKELVM